MQFEPELELYCTNENHTLYSYALNEKEVKLCLIGTTLQLSNTSVTELVTLSSVFHL